MVQSHLHGLLVRIGLYMLNFFFFFEKVLMLTIDNYLNGDPICLLVIIAEQYNL